MDNQTKSFQILAFSGNEANLLCLFLVFFLIYFLGILGNLVIIVVIYIDAHLHSPMYIFLSNLSLVDISYTSVTLPKLLYILISGNNSITFIQCFTQMYFYIFLAITETMLLSSMAYDRYIAICHPLHYHLIMNRKKCILFLIGTWVSGCGDSLFLTLFASNLSFCHSTKIQQLFCDIKMMAQISCADTGLYIVIITNILIFGLCTFMLNLISYIKILTSILSIQTTNGRKKAFSTCTSHFIVLILYYGTAMWMYLRPPSDYSEELDQLFSIIYLAVTPMLNPLIYSLRNKDVKLAMMRIWRLKTK